MLVEEVSQGCGVGERDAEDLQGLVDASVELQLVLDDGDEAVGDDGAIDLYVDGVLRLSPEPLDLQVLLQPLEEHLHMPTVLVEQGDLQCTDIHCVGEEGECPVLLLVVVDDPSEGLRVLLRGLVAGQLNLGVRQHAGRESAFPPDGLVPEVPLCPDDIEGICLGYPEKLAEEVVGTVEDVVGPGLHGYGGHGLRVVGRGRSDEDEGRDFRLYVVQRVHLYPALVPAKLGPAEHRQAQLDGRRVEGIDIPSEVENLRNPQFTSQFHHEEGVLLEDAIVPLAVGLGQVAARHPLAEAEVVSFPAMGFHGNHQVAQAFPSRQLSEHHHQHLVPTGERLDIAVSQVLGHYTIELAPVKE